MSVASEPLYHAYRGATALAGLFAPALLAWRRRQGREDARRLGERTGRASLARPEGTLVWMHGASVGESISLLPLVERILALDYSVLVTTGTVSSANILAKRLPPGARHQYLPLDAPAFGRRFLDHWKPDIALFAESELWPNFIHETRQRGIPLMLVNARLSDRSYQRWKRLPTMIAPLLTRIDLVLAQSRDDADKLRRLGAPSVRVAGNLKYDSPPPPVDAAELADLMARVGARPTWLAASTHAPEEEAAIEAHLALRREFPDLLTIIAPRHASRGEEIAALASARGVEPTLRSRGDAVGPDSGLYIADTMGEMGLFYRVAGIVFVGRSIAGAAGGQNPIEPAKLGAAILHGPAVANFVDIYATLDAAGGAAVVPDAASLSKALAALLADPARTRAMARKAHAAVNSLGGAVDVIMDSLAPYLAQTRAVAGQ